MGKKTEGAKIPVKVEFTDGYQERFTTAIMKIYEKRIRQEEKIRDEKDNKSA